MSDANTSPSAAPGANQTLSSLALLLVNSISVGRAAAAVAFATLALRPERAVIAVWFFILAAVSDAADGFLARKLGCVTDGGRALDLFGDKFLTIASALYAVFRGISLVVVLPVVGRELFLLAMRTVHVAGVPLVPLTGGLGVTTVLAIRLLTIALLLEPAEEPSPAIELAYWLCAAIYTASLSYTVYVNRHRIAKAFH